MQKYKIHDNSYNFSSQFIHCPPDSAKSAITNLLDYFVPENQNN